MSGEAVRDALEGILSSSDGRTRLVITANPIMVMTAKEDPEFRSILREADLLVPDGIGLLWAARRLGTDLPERITGTDLASYLIERRPAARLYLLGGKPGVAQRARERIESSSPGAIVSGCHHGYFQSQEEDRVVSDIRAAGTEVLLVGMGSPRQEKFIWRNREKLGAKVAIGVGGVLDVLSGEVRRAPPFVQKAGLEWLYRLACQPSRLRADLQLLRFVMSIRSRRERT